MKKITLFFALTSFLSLGLSQTPNTWTQKTNFEGSAREAGVAFSIGSKGYIGTGRSGSFLNYVYHKDLWEYDPVTNSWTQKANFAGTGRMEAIGFSIGSKGYIGTGYNNGNYYKDFWEYDPSTNGWTQKADFGGTARSKAVGFSIGSRGYIGTGRDGNIGFKNFWEYDPVTNSWTQRTSFGGKARYSAVGFSIGSKGYIGTGHTTGNNSERDFWEYDPSTNGWTKKGNFGGTERFGAVGFSIGDKGYIGTGYSEFDPHEEDFWGYDPATNFWKEKANFGGPGRNGAAGFSIGDKGYIGAGVCCELKDFWEYTPDNNFVNPCDIPTNLEANNISNNTANLKWLAGSESFYYVISYKTFGTSGWNKLLSTTNEKTLTGLMPNTKYVWKVKAICQLLPTIESPESSPSTFVTPPLRFQLESEMQSVEVYPNPLSNSAMISLSLYEDAHAVIKLLDVSGRKLQTIVAENLSAGNHEVMLNRGKLESGIYFLEVTIDDISEVKKIMIE